MIGRTPRSASFVEWAGSLRRSRRCLPVSIRVVTNLPMDGTEAITIRNRGTASEQQWKVAGARLEQGKVGVAICILTGRPSVASHTICSIPRGRGFVEVDVTRPVDRLSSIATVAALVQRAMSRL
jgi:hypothetical protein